MKTIPIIFSSNENYIPYLCACLQSLISHTSRKTIYDINVLYTNLSEDRRLSILNMETLNVKINFININKIISKYSQDLFSVCEHFSIETYYRFFLPEIFPKLDKLIYIDCDTIIQKDIAQLYNIDIEDKCIGATQCCGIIRSFKYGTKQYQAYFKDILKLKNIYEYFQAGVMILNLTQWRKVNLTSQLLQCLAKIKTPKLVDQDILNSVCQGKVKFIPMNWNYTWHIPYVDGTYYEHIGSPLNKQYQNAKEHPYIIHFTGHGYKPDEKPYYRESRIFWHYARQTPFYEEILYKNLKVTPAQNITQQITKVADMSIIREIKNYSKNRFNYYRCKLLANFTFGKMRKHYKDKKKRLKAKIKEVRRFLKGK